MGMAMATDKHTDQGTMSPEQAREAIGTAGGARALDLRSEEDWLEGRVPGCVRVEGDELESALEDLEEGQQVIVVCEDGRRSAEVAEQLRERGLEAASIEGGMEAWRDDKMPMQPSYDPDEEAHV
jgi:rhodanese-related sulfurtransferase